MCVKLSFYKKTFCYTLSFSIAKSGLRMGYFPKLSLHYVAISHANSNRNKPIKQAVCDRGYVGAKVVLGANIILPKKALKRDNNKTAFYPVPQKTLGILQKINPVFAKTKK
jgi:hypothetical protein